MNTYKITTLNDFITLRQKDFPYAKGELSSLLTHIGTAAKIVNKKINKAGLVDLIGRTGTVNVQGESQEKRSKHNKVTHRRQPPPPRVDQSQVPQAK